MDRTLGVRHPRPLAFLLMLVALLDPWLLGQEAPSAKGIQLDFEVPLHRPLLVEVKVAMDAEIDITSSDLEWSDSFDYKEEVTFVDELRTRSDSDWTGTRDYVKYHSTTSGEISDNALSGVKASYTAKGDDIRVELLENRLLTDGFLDLLLASSGSLGLPLVVPSETTVGGKAVLDLARLTPVLVDAMDDVSAKADCVLESFDPVSTEAKFKGKAVIRGGVDYWEIGSTLEITGDFLLHCNVAQGRILSMSLEGAIAFGVKEGDEVDGKGTYKVTVATDIGKRAAEAARAKPAFRTKKIWAYRLGVGMKLPSHWSRLSTSPEAQVFARTLDSDKGKSFITLQLIDESSANPNLVFDKTFAWLKSKYPGIIMEKTKNPLGGADGRIYYIPKGDQGDDMELFQSEYYPWRGKFLLFKLYGPPKAYRAALPEFLKAKDSLRPLAPARGKR